MCIKKEKKRKETWFWGWRVDGVAELKHRRILFSLLSSRSSAVSDLRVNSLRSLATASFPSIRRRTVALKVVLSYKHWAARFFFVHFFSGIHLMSFFLWAIRWSVTVKGTGIMSTNSWRLLRILIQPLLIFLQEAFVRRAWKSLNIWEQL
jgi:hypothetical protein